MTGNPFFETRTTPFGLPPFDRIRPEHFPPAFDRGMEEELALVQAIADSAEPPTFANTVEAAERCGRRLATATGVFYNLYSSCTNDALDAIARDYAPRFAQHYTSIVHNPAFFARVDALFRQRHELGLDTAQMRLLERNHLEFVRAGAALASEAKARMAAIAERLATLHTEFGQNVLHDEKAWQLVLEEGDLDGLPGFARDAAAEAARERGLDGKYVITLARSSVEPFLTFSARRDLRRKAYEAWTERGGLPGDHDNTPLIKEIVALRAEQARLLGFPSYAAFKLADSMAKDVDSVERLLLQVWEPAKRKAATEKAVLEEQARAGGLNEPLARWDWRFYAEKVRQARYDLDEAEVKPYFVLDRMVQAAFDTATKLFGITFHAIPDAPVYHPDVKVYEVRDTGGAHVGLFLHDNLARSGKRSGAWMSSYRDQEALDGPVSPIIVNNNNFAKGQPTLLSFDDAETLFHEFGHGLHGLLSRVRYRSQSGTSVRRDFVEFPSQVYEHWMSAPETLRKYAVHHETGEPIPESLLNRLLAARNFNQGFATVEYTAAALLDMAFHTEPEPDAIDVPAFERAVLDRIGLPAEIGVRHRPPHFQHLFAGSGYAAGYYAYLWAEVLDADGFEAFSESGDLFDPKLSAGLKAIYSAGDTRDPMELYVAFRGREPRIEPLLKHRGLVEETPKAA
ncbi:M3 family metallopeptidase [Azospirillum sp. RWY-5-1]|uniref:M3 family metallopeptidase n=2 Tax=Azospirillum oleiclasticum TaxID=2735135 RepID=A0ABX2T2J2_9PROT|nr:M3 family metallopeptidase [Azospirillum oleiclasticum]NYZ18521.1 M3 family metallopeptidase [Azospirillum oleiclasticum]